MTMSFNKILSSRTFQFLLGPDTPDRKPFTIHTAVLEEHSAPLAALMNGLMLEAIDRIAIIEDIEEHTFVRFCEYAYMGDYTPAQQQLVLEAPHAVSMREDSDEFFGSGKKTKKDAKRKGKNEFGWGVVEEVERSCGKCGREALAQSLWDDFRRRDYTVVSPKLRPREHREEGEDKASLFLCHARVYVFADRYDVAGLCALALDKLHHALCSFRVAKDHMGKVVDLARFSYSNDNTRDNEVGQEMDRLRTMVIDYVVCAFDTIVKDNSFLDLVEEGGCFARDLTRLLGERVIKNAG